MRKTETVAEGIKRRSAQAAETSRRRIAAAVQIAIWSGVIGFIVVMISIAASSGVFGR
jgi:hypothetical protein